MWDETVFIGSSEAETVYVGSSGWCMWAETVNAGISGIRNSECG